MSKTTQKHEIKLVGGPLDNQAQTVVGQLPFRQFLIDGSLELPVWHSYALADQGYQEDVPLEMHYEGTADFFQMAEILRLFKKDR